MKQHILVVPFLVTLLATSAVARVWTDSTGAYAIEADLVAFDDDQVILQRNADSELGSVPLDRLSEADREYLATSEAEAQNAKFSEAPQTWNMKSGLKVQGRVVDYVQREVTFQRRRGKIYVNDRVLENLPKIYQRIAPQIVGHYEQNKVSDAQSLKSWLVHRKGAPQSYQVEGVVLELPSGDEYAVPFFLFSDEDLGVLKPGWDDWLAVHGEYARQQDESFELQSLAAAYKQDSESRRRIAEVQLGLQAVETGLTSLWEVTLYPDQNMSGQPLWVVVAGRDSRTAQQNAMVQNPGYVLGPVRRVSR